jgi:hypothetical protein
VQPGTLEQRPAFKPAQSIIGVPVHGCDGQVHPCCPAHMAGDWNEEQSAAVPLQD